MSCRHRGLAPLLSSDMHFERGQDEEQECLRVHTDGGVYSYQSAAGGFSSIQDRDGVDWIGFHPGEPESPAGAANVFRGLPNLVFPDNIGHPGYELCRSRHRFGDKLVEIETESRNGLWSWSVRIRESHAEIAVKKTPPARPYWFLYEGVPAGRYDPQGVFWGTDGGPYARLCGGERRPTRPVSLSGVRWIYFGHSACPRVFFCAHHTEDGEDIAESTLFFMNAAKSDDDDGGTSSPDTGADGMVVFGFGRTPRTKPLLLGEHLFHFGFIESVQHEEIASVVARQVGGSA